MGLFHKLKRRLRPTNNGRTKEGSSPLKIVSTSDESTCCVTECSTDAPMTVPLHLYPLRKRLQTNRSFASSFETSSDFGRSASDLISTKSSQLRSLLFSRRSGSSEQDHHESSFDDDHQHHHHHGSVQLSSSDDEYRDDTIGLLQDSGGANVSSSCSFEFERQQEYDDDNEEEEIIFEPSFEVSLMDPNLWLTTSSSDRSSSCSGGSSSQHSSSSPQLDTDGSTRSRTSSASSEGSLNSADGGSSGASCYDGSCEDDSSRSSSSHSSRTTHTITSQDSSANSNTEQDCTPQKGYDLYGRPFLHIFHEGLSTLYEQAEDDDEETNRSTRTLKTQQEQTATPDAVQLKARWELARAQLSDDHDSSDGHSSRTSRSDDVDDDAGVVIVTPRSGIRSAYEI